MSPDPEAGPPCAKKDCGGPARWRVGLVLRAPAPHDDAPPVPAWLGLALCDACRATATAEDFISNQGWAMVQAGFMATGHMKPDRVRTSLDWVELGSPEDREIVRLFERTWRAL